MPVVRYENAVVFQGKGLPLLSSITIANGLVVAAETVADEVIDCQSSAILPAFGDAHCHPLLAARGSLGPNLSDCRSIEDIRKEVDIWARSHPEARWIFGGFYDRDLAPEGRFSRFWLDDLDSRPIVLQCADQHAIWVNTAALEAAGLLHGTRDHFGVDFEGELALGTLREDAKQHLLSFVPEVPAPVLARAIARQLDYLASLGIVFALDAWVDESGLEAYELVEHPVRVDTAFWVRPETNLAEIPETQSVKLFVDGVIGSATALVREPFSCKTSHPHGVSSWKRETFESAVRGLANGQRQVYVHAIGDAAIDWVIDASIGLSDVHIEHGEMLTSDQIQRITATQSTVCFQPLWARPDAMMKNAVVNLGAKRANLLYPMAELESAGGRFVFGSDWPVSSADALLGLYTAITRSEPGSTLVHNPENRVSLETAIAAYSTGDTSGEKPLAIRQPRKLTPGSRADFILLDGNPFAHPQQLPELTVLQTISGGQTIFTRH